MLQPEFGIPVDDNKLLRLAADYGLIKNGNRHLIASPNLGHRRFGGLCIINDTVGYLKSVSGIPQLRFELIWVGSGESKWIITLPTRFQPKNITPEDRARLEKLKEVLGVFENPQFWYGNDCKHSEPKCLRKHPVSAKMKARMLSDDLVFELDRELPPGHPEPTMEEIFDEIMANQPPSPDPEVRAY